MRAIIISAANEGYFPLLKGLVLSILEHRPDENVGIAALDIGMRTDQIEELQSLNVVVIPAKWDFDFRGMDETPRYLQAMTARPCLPNYFPDSDLLIWIDADAWLQDWRAIEALMKATSAMGVAIVPELDRSYGCVWQRGRANHDNQFIHSLYVEAYGETLARKLGHIPMMNVGVFAARSDSPVWSAWQNRVKIGLSRRVHRMIEQNALNAAICGDGIGFYPLPAYCNWLCGQAVPVFDFEKRRFLESLIPHDPISILHVTPRKFAVLRADIGNEQRNIPLDYIEHKAFLSKMRGGSFA